MANAKAHGMIAHVQRRAVFKEIGRELNKLYAPRPDQKLPEGMEVLLAKLQAKAS